jgi:hypothetical protein
MAHFSNGPEHDVTLRAPRKIDLSRAHDWDGG